MLIAEEDAGGLRRLAVRDAEFRAIFRGDELESVQVFDVNVDPDERHDISESPQAHAFLERAHAATDEHLSAARSHRKRYQLGPLFKRDHKLSREERDQLRMLG
jgi:hypothetical protein